MELTVKRFEELTTTELYALLKARAEVFVMEQHCYYLDMDERDKRAWHVMLTDGERVCAYLRVLDAGVSFAEVSLGRVLTTERGKGYGKEIVGKGIAVARGKLHADRIRIEAQVHTIKFYEKFGFRQVSGEFLDAGIPHVEMLLEL